MSHRPDAADRPPASVALLPIERTYICNAICPPAEHLLFRFQVGERDNTWDQFCDDIQVKDGDNDDCRYAVYDYDYVQQAEGTEASYR